MREHFAPQSSKAADESGFRKYLELAQIRLDGQTQSRAQMYEATVAEYAEAMREGAVFPPVVVFSDGAALWLADGFHRYSATLQAGFPTVLAEVRSGARRDAVLYGLGANTNHGLRETRADRRRKIEIMLQDEEWVQWSDREIGRQCGVDHKTVAAARADLVERGEIPHVDVRTDSTGRQQPVVRVPAPATSEPETPSPIAEELQRQAEASGPLGDEARSEPSGDGPLAGLPAITVLAQQAAPATPTAAGADGAVECLRAERWPSFARS